MAETYGYYFEYAGVNSKEMGVEVSYRPSIPLKQRVYSEIVIPGRGVLKKDEGYYKNIEFSLDCSINMERDHWMDKMRDIKENWLIGTGNLFFSDDLDYFYKVVSVDITEITRLMYTTGVFTIKFTCKPHAYLKEGQELYPLIPGGSNIIHNTKYDDSYPIFKLDGVGGYNIRINNGYINGTIDGELIIDCEEKVAIQNGIPVGVSTGLISDLILARNAVSNVSFAVSASVNLFFYPNWRI